MDTSARLLKLLSLLQARRDWPGPELADRLGIDVRTVRRDVERLRGLGYPVHATPGVAGGYRLGTGAVLPPLLLDDDEAVAVAVGLRTAAGGTVDGIEEISVRALAKLEQMLPARLRHRVSTLHSATVSLAAGVPAVDPDALTAIASACRDHQRLTFGYRTHDGTPSERRAEPLRLVCTGRRWYLLAYDLGREDWRTFRVDRIDGVPAAGFRFTPRNPPAEDLVAYVSEAISSAPYPHQAEILVHAPADQVAAYVGPSTGLVEPVDERTCLVRTGAHAPEDMALHLAHWPFDFEVREPPELAEKLRLIADRFTRAVR